MIAERLRKSILQAAIQGKLTEQLPEDGDARDLLKEIQKEKYQLIKEKKIKKEEALPEITEDEIPFEIPEGWCWVRLGEIANYKKGPFGSALKKSIFVPDSENSIKVYEQKNAIQKNANLGEYYITKEYYENHVKGFAVEPGDIIISCAGTIGEAYILPHNIRLGIINQALMRVRLTSFIDKHFYLICFDYAITHSNVKGKGTAIKNIPPFEVLKNLLMPVPPITEQLRIIDKLSDIFRGIKELEKDETKLDTLQKAFPKKMKDSLLQSAIQGKLTEQLESDGDAHDLVAEIQKEKARLIKEGKIKKEKDLVAITEDEIPFDIPENWSWVRLGEVCQYIQRGKSPKYSPIEKYPVVAQKCNQWDGFHIEKAQFIQPESVASYSEERLLRDDDLMWNSTGLGTLGRMAVYKDAKNPYDFAVADSHVTVVRTFKDRVHPQFIFSYIVGPYIQSIVEDISSGSTKQKELSTDTVKKLPIPLPPLAEQHRIVERLDQLLPLCHALE